MSKAAVPIGVVAIVLMLVVPLPAAVLDLLLGLNVTASLLILLVAMQIRRPLDFAVFPSLILIATLFRLALNVSSTRLVLTDGYAGKVIEAFGHFVIGGSLVVGLVIFVILTIIQFVVITNGAGRVAEVGARFTLDAMPGKQMAIDADLNAGLINEEQARKRRTEVTSEADFYGSMDGASKFVKGDAIAAIVITLINLVGGFAIGIMQRGMAPGEAVATYSLLTVGDGLVSQIPALLLSTATGIIVTRSASDGDMGSDLLGQLGRFKQPVRISGGAALALCLIPGLPKLPFLVIGGAFLLMAARMQEAPADDEAAPAPVDDEPKPDSPSCRSSSSAARCCSRRPESWTRTPAVRRRTARPTMPYRWRRPSRWSPTSRSTRSGSSSLRTSSTSSTRPRAATCSTGSRRCARRSPPTSAS